MGSGYPADPKTKLFIERGIDGVFGFPTLARFSWSTISKALEKGGCECDWNEPDENDQDRKDSKNGFRKFAKVSHSKSRKNRESSHIALAVRQNITNADKFFEDRLLSRSQTVLGTSNE